MTQFICKRGMYGKKTGKEKLFKADRFVYVSLYPCNVQSLYGLGSIACNTGICTCKRECPGSFHSGTVGSFNGSIYR